MRDPLPVGLRWSCSRDRGCIGWRDHKSGRSRQLVPVAWMMQRRSIGTALANRIEVARETRGY